MTYALPADVANEFRQITFDGTSDITEIRVQGFLDEAEAEINTSLAIVYVTPITGTESLLVVKRIEIAIVAARIAAIIDLKRTASQSTDKNIQQDFNKSGFARAARKSLENLKNRITTLTDAELLNSDFGMSSETVDLDITPVFEKDKEQW